MCRLLGEGRDQSLSATATATMLRAKCNTVIISEWNLITASTYSIRTTQYVRITRQVYCIILGALDFPIQDPDLTVAGQTTDTATRHNSWHAPPPKVMPKIVLDYCIIQTPSSRSMAEGGCCLPSLLIRRYVSSSLNYYICYCC